MATDGGSPKATQLAKAEYANLDKPEKLAHVLKEDKVDDCLTCRITGSAAFFALGGYVYYSGRRALAVKGPAIIAKSGQLGYKSRIMALTALTSSLVGLGMVRLVR